MIIKTHGRTRERDNAGCGSHRSGRAPGRVSLAWRRQSCRQRIKKSPTGGTEQNRVNSISSGALYCSYLYRPLLVYNVPNWENRPDSGIDLTGGVSMDEEWEKEEETRWGRSSEKNESSESGMNLIRIRSTSKFSTGEASITFEEIAREWESWDKGARLDFVLGYSRKRPLDEEDLKILEYLVEHVGPDEIEVNMLSLLMAKLPDLPGRKKVLRFIITQIRDVNPEKIDEGGKNVMHAIAWYEALGKLGDPGALPFLKEKIAEMLEYPGLYAEWRHVQYKEAEGIPEASYNYVATIFVTALTALCRLEPRDDFRKLLEGFTLHPDRGIRSLAEHSLRELDSSPDGSGTEEPGPEAGGRADE